MKHWLAVLALVLAGTFTAGGAHDALASPAQPADRAGAPAAEIFATSNTAIITDPNDPRLQTRLVGFAHQVTDIVADAGGDPDGSTLLNGVFWDAGLQLTTYERSREFNVDRVSTVQLHDDAAVIRDRFHQQSVLTFEPLPSTSPRAQAIEVRVPGIDVRQLHDGLVADPTARDHLGGGSVTLGGRLLLVAGLADLALVQRFVVSLGGSWAASTVRFGAEEFV
jgi:hypothetical protein